MEISSRWDRIAVHNSKWQKKQRNESKRDHFDNISQAKMIASQFGRFLFVSCRRVRVVTVFDIGFVTSTSSNLFSSSSSCFAFFGKGNVRFLLVVTTGVEFETGLSDVLSVSLCWMRQQLLLWIILRKTDLLIRNDRCNDDFSRDGWRRRIFTIN